MASSRPLSLSGQRGHAHHEGHRHGTFHTWDKLDLDPHFAPRKVHVFLPTELEAGRRYPTIYLHDGDAVFWPGGAVGGCWGAAETVDALRGEGQIDPVILVAVHPVARDAEYTHVDWGDGQRPWGGLPQHAAYLAHRVKGFIDAHYPTRPEPEATAVAGSSHGGLAAFYTATAHPERFGLAAAISPSFFSGLDSMRHGPGRVRLADSPLMAMAHATLADPTRRPKLWISWGSRRDGGDHNAIVEAMAARRGAEMIDLLREGYGYRSQTFEDGARPRSDAELFTWIDPMGGHDERAWAWHLRLVLQAFFPAS